MANLVFSKIREFFSSGQELQKERIPEKQIVAMANPMAGTFRTLFTHSFNGEKNLGELGPMKEYAMNYGALRVRSWQSFVENPITQTIVKRYATWMIGDGLKLQVEPSKRVLKREKIEIDQEFNEAVECRFAVYAKSKMADYAGMRNLNHIAKTAFTNCLLGGDVLVVLRVVKGIVKVQLIDGAHVVSPQGGTEYWPNVTKEGNLIKNGIEMTPEGEHIAYHVLDMNYTYQRILARGPKSGMLMAYMVYDSEYRVDSVRGLPRISMSLETLAKMERYKEATLGSAEERQKIAFAIEHANFSTGENPMAKDIVAAYDLDQSSDQLPTDSQGVELANTIAASTNKQAWNLPLGASLKTLESKNELYFKDFHSVHVDLICASINIPPEVAMSKYDSNFSASRAALKDWEHTLHVGRNSFSPQFYQPIYNLWLETEILKNNIQAPGYLNAAMKGNEMVMEAFRSARWVGAPVPHIDPLKEVNAVRAKLGSTSDAIPLTTVEAATEALNGGESYENMEQYAEELKRSKMLGIVEPEKTMPSQKKNKKSKPSQGD